MLNTARLKVPRVWCQEKYVSGDPTCRSRHMVRSFRLHHNSMLLHTTKKPCTHDGGNPFVNCEGQTQHLQLRLLFEKLCDVVDGLAT